MKNMKNFMIVIALILLCTGCVSEKWTADNRGQNGSSDSKAMGRYVEEELEYPEGMDSRIGFTELADGSLYIFDDFGNAFVSKDVNKGWEETDSPISSEISEDTFIINAAAARDKSCAIIYSDVDEGSEFGYRMRYTYINANGEQKNLNLPMDYTMEDYIQGIWFSPDYKLYGASVDNKVYEINVHNSSLKLLFDTQDYINNITFQDNLLIGTGESRVYFYDLDKGVLMEEDSLLDQFVMDNGYPVIIAPSQEKQVFHIACSGGLYRYVLYGNAVEQVVDGSLCTLGNPAYEVVSFKELENGEYLVLFDGGKLIKYVFDKNVPTIPDKEIRIYSLEENKVIRQAAAAYQKSHQDIYVRYETGMSQDNTGTKEDAIKKLNTQLIAGNGPDVLVMDGLPASNLAEKGLLEDLSETVGKIAQKNPIMDNFLDAMNRDGKIYMLPARFRLPLIMGPKEYIDHINDLESLADTLEKIRGEKPEGSIMGIYKEEQVLELLGMVSENRWVNDKEEIDREAVKEFLTQTKRIYEAEQEGISVDELEEYENGSYYTGSTMIVPGDKAYYRSIQTNMQDFYTDKIWLAAGYSENMILDFTAVTSMVQEKDNLDYRILNGQQENSLLLNTLTAVNSGAREPEAARDFIVSLFTESWTDDSNGFPTGVKTFEECMVNSLEDNNYGAMTFDGPDGKLLVFNCYWPEEKDLGRLKDLVRTGIPYIENTTVNETVYSIGVKVLKEELGIEEAVEEIWRKISVYLAE